MSEDKFLKAKEDYGIDAFEGGMGAEAIRECLKALELDDWLFSFALR
jgi:DNA-directed RNA polymerase subunit beta'